jgi:hypothetical protein
VYWVPLFQILENHEQIARALQGDYRPEHLFVLKQALQTFRFFHDQLQDCDRETELYLAELGFLHPRLPCYTPAGYGLGCLAAKLLSC